MAIDEKRTENRLSELERLKESAQLGGGKERIEAQHGRGKLTARERLNILMDEGSFEELDSLVTHRSPRVRSGEAEMLRRRRSNRLRNGRRAGWFTSSLRTLLSSAAPCPKRWRRRYAR